MTRSSMSSPRCRDWEAFSDHDPVAIREALSPAIEVVDHRPAALPPIDGIDANAGFYAIRVTNGVWPFTSAARPGGAPGVESPRSAGPVLPATGAATPVLGVLLALLAAILRIVVTHDCPSGLLGHQSKGESHGRC